MDFASRVPKKREVSMERDRKRKGYTEWREYVNQEGTVVGLIETILKCLFFPFFHFSYRIINSPNS